MGSAASIVETSKSDDAGDQKLMVKSPQGFTPQVFVVSLGFWPNATIELPPVFKLRISYESLDFVKEEDLSPIVQFPYQNIICWGSSHHNFQFKIFNFEENAAAEQKENGILISLKTNQGRTIEDWTMATVQKLMVDIKQRAISKPEFGALLDNIFDQNQDLKENWMQIIEQFTSSGRLFLAKQGMELLLRIGKIAPFDKFELACFLYDRIINKDSYQLLINTFEDAQERDNLIHRLKLNKTNKKEVVTDCAILPERV